MFNHFRHVILLKATRIIITEFIKFININKLYLLFKLYLFQYVAWIIHCNI